MPSSGPLHDDPPELEDAFLSVQWTVVMRVLLPAFAFWVSVLALIGLENTKVTRNLKVSGNFPRAFESFNYPHRTHLMSR